LRILTFDVKKGFQALNPGELKLRNSSAIMLMVEHVWKSSKIKQHCEKLNQQLNSTKKQYLRILTFDDEKGFRAQNPGALELCYCSSILFMAKHAWKQWKNEQNCEKLNQQSNSKKKQHLPILTCEIPEG
jgi:hypothetical protein